MPVTHNISLKKNLTLKRRLDFAEAYLAKQVPSGFKVVIEHDDNLQPTILVTAYKNAIGVENDGLDTSEMFGGGTITYLATELSYDYHKACIEMPFYYALLSARIEIPRPNTLLLIEGNNVIKITLATGKILTGHIVNRETLIPPVNLNATKLSETSYRLKWERSE